MKEKVYRSLYRQICLSEGQKERVWTAVQREVKINGAERKPYRMLRWAVCACTVLTAAGITALAANPSWVDRIARALGYLIGREEVTQNQEALYAAYGAAMEQGWTSEAGEVRLEAVLYDRSFLCIPFTLYPDRELSPGADISSEPVFDELRQSVIGQWGRFQRKGGAQDDFSCVMRMDPVVQEDGSLAGSFLLTNTKADGFAQGDTIQLINWENAMDGDVLGRVLEDGENADGLETFVLEENGEWVTYVDLMPEEEVLTEFRLESGRVPEIEISTADMQLPYGILADRITISPLALYLNGTGDDTHPAFKITYNISVVLKDGSVVRGGDGFSWNREAEPESQECRIWFSMAFEDAVNLDEIAGVRITDRGEEICFIPVE